MNLCRLRGLPTLSALHKLDANREGDRLARSDNVLSNCWVISPVSGLQHACIS